MPWMPTIPKWTVPTLPFGMSPEWVANQVRSTLKKWDDDEALALAKQGRTNPDLPPWVPDPPLLVAPPDTEWVPFPNEMPGWAGYWEKDEEKSTPFPSPVHTTFDMPDICVRMHSAIPGILVEESEEWVKIILAPIPELVDKRLKKVPMDLLTYTETFRKDNGVHARAGVSRDVAAGRTHTQGFMAKDGTMYGRIQKRGIIMRNTVEWTCEDVVHMDPSGEYLTVEQHVRDNKGRSATMQLVGRRRDASLAKAMLQQE